MASGVAANQMAGVSVKAAGRRELTLLPSKNSRSNRQPPRLALVALFDEVVDQFARGVIHLHVEILDTPGEIVERHHGWNGHQEAERRGHKGFRKNQGNS